MAMSTNSRKGPLRCPLLSILRVGRDPVASNQSRARSRTAARWRSRVLGPESRLLWRFEPSRPHGQNNRVDDALCRIPQAKRGAARSGEPYRPWLSPAQVPSGGAPLRPLLRPEHRAKAETDEEPHTPDHPVPPGHGPHRRQRPWRASPSFQDPRALCVLLVAVGRVPRPSVPTVSAPGGAGGPSGVPGEVARHPVPGCGRRPTPAVRRPVDAALCSPGIQNRSRSLDRWGKRLLAQAFPARLAIVGRERWSPARLHPTPVVGESTGMQVGRGRYG
jgi:hypothetical protein